MSAITDYFEKLQREHYKKPKSDNRLMMLVWLLMVVMMAALTARH